MRQVISGEYNGRTEEERAELIRQDWEANGYKAVISKEYQSETYKTIITITSNRANSILD